MPSMMLYLNVIYSFFEHYFIPFLLLEMDLLFKFLMDYILVSTRVSYVSVQ